MCIGFVTWPVGHLFVPYIIVCKIKGSCDKANRSCENMYPVKRFLLKIAKIVSFSNHSRYVYVYTRISLIQPYMISYNYNFLSK